MNEELVANKEQAIGFLKACVLFSNFGNQQERTISAELACANILENNMWFPDFVYEETTGMLDALEEKYTKK